MIFKAKSLACIFSAIVLTACGGGGGTTSTGGGGDVITPPVVVTPNSISGIASAGSPVNGGSLAILSLNNSAIYQPTDTTSSDGSFSITIDKVAYPPPYIIKVVDGSSGKSYFSFANDVGAGALVTPISTAAVSLAANKSADDVFANVTSITTSQYSNAASLLYAAVKNVFNDLAINSADQLINSLNYLANGIGADSALDIIKITNTNASNGNVLITTKFPSTAIQLNSTTTTASVNSMSLNTSLIASILSRINSTTQNCLASSINANSSSQFVSCADQNFMDSGQTASQFFSSAVSYVGNNITIAPASINWCVFNLRNLNFSSTQAALANQVGICEAQLPLKLSNNSIMPVTSRFKFSVNSAGTQVNLFTLYGNQFNDTLAMYPAIMKKIRIDGTAANLGNQGLTSGYKIDIGTGLSSNGSVVSTSNISAKVILVDSAASIIGTYYMQCTQSAGHPSQCRDSMLSFCLLNSPSCTGGIDINNEVDKIGQNIIPVDSSAAAAIITALQSGPVYANIKTYNTTLDLVTDNTAVLSNQIIPIVGTPISSSDAQSINLPALTSNSQQLMAAWTGATNLALNFSNGNASVYGASFGTSVNHSGQDLMIKSGASSINFTQIGGGLTYTAVTNTSHTNCPNQDNYRALYIAGVYQNVPLIVKYFGSCGLQNF